MEGQLGSLGLALAHGVASSFWRQVALNAVSPAVAALLGGFVVSILVQQAQARRERAAGVVTR